MARYLGSEVSADSALGVCYKNSGSSRWSSYWCIVVVQEIGAWPNVPLRSNAFGVRYWGSVVYDGFVLGFCYKRSDRSK